MKRTSPMIDEIGPSSGWLVPGGKDAAATFKRSVTVCRAR